MRYVLGSRASIGGPLGCGRGGAAAWYLAGGTISAIDVAEFVEFPTNGQLYAGANLGSTWTVALRTTWNGSTAGMHAFDTQTGRLAIGVVSSANGFFNGLWRNITLFNTDDSVYFVINNAGTVQAYRNASAIGATYSGTNISGTTTWRSAYLGPGASTWTPTVPRGAIYKIALNSTQRAALYSSMAA